MAVSLSKPHHQDPKNTKNTKPTKMKDAPVAQAERLSQRAEQPEHHPKATQPLIFVFIVLLSVAGAIIGMQILTTLGITPNTALIGVLVAIAVSRIPVHALRSFRSIHAQNLIQSSISAATFGAANSLLLPIGIPMCLGRPDLVPTMLLGATMGMLIDLAMLYWFFDSRLFPGSAAWPHGVAAAEAILAGDQGGKRAAVLGIGTAAGIVGSSSVFGLLAPLVGMGGLPMSAFGVAFIGNTWALFMFAVGLLVRAYCPALLKVDFDRLLVPHGMMIGAGLVALTQAILMITRKRQDGAAAPAERYSATRSEEYVRGKLAAGLVLYVFAAVLLAVMGGLWEGLTLRQFVLWCFFAAISCIAAEFIVGLSAMHAGWFPAFATALIFMVLGLAMGFPPAATALLVGFVASGGPAFADAGYDLKAGWCLRRGHRQSGFEMEGRREQIIAALIGLLTALAVVILFHNDYFSRDLFPPVDRVYAATIRAGIDPSLVSNLFIWAIPGALIQFIGGMERQLGILLATGLLISNPGAGWLLLLGILARGVLRKMYKKEAETPMAIFGAGCIAGDALWGFASSAARAGWIRR